MAISIPDIFAKARNQGIRRPKVAEKKAYLSWADTLAKKDVTIEDLKRTLPAELERANRKLSNHDITVPKLNYYQAYANLCRFMITAITGPENDSHVEGHRVVPLNRIS
jgi:hypothetical protein